MEEVCRLSREGRRAEAHEALERDAVRRRAQQDAERRAFEEEMGRLELLRLEDSVPLDLGYRIEKT